MLDDSTDVRRIDPEGWPQRPTMAQVVVANGVAYLSGVIATDPAGRLIGENDPAAQAEACLNNIAAILAAVGATVDDILRCTCFATHPDAASAYIAERNRRMTVRPAATTVLVSGLLLAGAMLEVEVIAKVRP